MKDGKFKKKKRKSMASINLENQYQISLEIKPSLISLKDLIAIRKSVWIKLSKQSKKDWKDSGKDPILDLAWDIYENLKEFFNELNME